MTKIYSCTNELLFESQFRSLGTALVDASKRGYCLNGANLRGKEIRGKNLSDILLDGADFTDANISWCNFDYGLLGRANFTNSNLSYCTFGGSSLENAVFFGSCIYGCVFTDVKGQGANFEETEIRLSNFTGNLNHARFRDASMFECKFSSSSLVDSSLFSASTMYGCSFGYDTVLPGGLTYKEFREEVIPLLKQMGWEHEKGKEMAPLYRRLAMDLDFLYRHTIVLD